MAYILINKIYNKNTIRNTPQDSFNYLGIGILARFVSWTVVRCVSCNKTTCRR